MKREDFKEIKSIFINSCEKILEYDSCIGEEAIACTDCPFYIKNMNINGDFVCYAENENQAAFAKEFLEMCKTEGILHEDGSITEKKIISEKDNVNSPNHYKLKINGNDIEVIDIIRAVLTPEEFRGYEKGNVLKYILREKNKNGLEDLKKGNKYLDWLIREEEK